ncbi:MAG: hypothetical protein MK078_02390 [Crocinitomicaceae bacterium]|nr:hypothetical protein [Crocinitomicaceae bacterium]
MKVLSCIGLICIALYSCKKEESTINQIVLGETEGMIIAKTHVLIGDCEDCLGFGHYVDLNSDGIDDFRFSTNYHDTDWYYFSQTSFASENNRASFLVQQSIEEVYLKKDTIYTDTLIDGSLKNIEYSRSWSECSYVSDYDSIAHVNYSVPVFFNENEVVQINKNEWSNGASIINKIPSWLKNGSTDESNPDTLRANLYFNNFLCVSTPKDEIKYFVFKIESETSTRVGWVKFMLNEKFVEIYEWALQI